MTHDTWRLVADIGGTNIRFGRAPEPFSLDDEIVDVLALPLKRFASIAQAIDAYLAGLMDISRPASVAIGAAGPVIGGAVELTNAPYEISVAAVRAALGTERVCLVNDLEAVARAVPLLGEHDLVPIRTLPPNETWDRAPALAVNVGTGFGAAAVARRDIASTCAWVTLAAEPGHISAPGFPPDGNRRAAIEDFLSGRGVARAATILADGRHVFERAVEVFAAFEADAAARQVSEAFAEAFGRAVRDLVLAHGAWQGVFLVGSVAHGWAEHCPADRFDQAFAAPSPIDKLMRSVPVHLVKRPEPALLGLAVFEVD
ncbi:MAG: glucokinase [Pseudomonadota bacterium]